MKTLITAAALALFTAAPAAAQAPTQGAGDTGPSAVAGVRELWQTSRDYILGAAQQVPEADYGYRPAPEVRSMGQLFAHVAASQRMLCAMALGERNDFGAAGSSKAEIIAALRASNDYCARAYAGSDRDAARLAPPSDSISASLLGGSHTRFYVLAMNAWHDSEHYGNIVTYMRLKGMVPPSSQPKP
ncbi:MAG TPA: DinB family protein [Longimicrobium sp.]|nr:DinB family protein [Longimicrobium sp.]